MCRSFVHRDLSTIINSRPVEAADFAILKLRHRPVSAPWRSQRSWKCAAPVATKRGHEEVELDSEEESEDEGDGDGDEAGKKAKEGKKQKKKKKKEEDKGREKWKWKYSTLRIKRKKLPVVAG
ncbi:Uu.00g099710.m01.CDS01 [Anthostomella pinea]|uniref:Uu.00g099710.m01.CDS01 n=1 Tax=Anthostomella pinea TaxID=933095 RepID=A0AAI8YF95_9PEZI|nr:Uu.00g099710.m01.CDS01 [Anthostomella pinea]